MDILLNTLGIILLVVIGYFVFVFPVTLLNVKFFRANYESKPGFGEVIKAGFPFYNITYARRIAYSRSPVFTVLITVGLLLVLVRIVLINVLRMFVTTISPDLFIVLVTYSSYVAIAGICLLYILYVINLVDFARMLQQGMLTMLLCIILAPVGYYVVQLHVISFFKAEEDEVSGRFGT